MIENRAALVEHLVKTGSLKSPEIIAAFKAIDRADFVLPHYKSKAYHDEPFPIGESQTISQPYVVAKMLELLQVQKGERVLDVGAGSGWTTALLAFLTGKTGQVFGVELLASLLQRCHANLSSYPFKNISLHKADIELGLKAHAPFDKILVSAQATQVPPDLLAQLKVGGIMVLPVANSLFSVTKKTEVDLEIVDYPGFIFVPLIEPKTHTKTKKVLQPKL